MIFLTKLKAAAASAAVALVLAGAVGPGLVPATAQDAAPAVAAKATPRGTDDAAFLDRICLDLRGSKATAVEHTYFAADADAGKRHKVTTWLLADPRVKAHLGGGPEREYGLWLNAKPHDYTDSDLDGVTVSAAGNRLAKAVAFSPDGKRVAVERSWVELYDARTGKAEPARDVLVADVARLVDPVQGRRVEVQADKDAPAAVVKRVADAFQDADVKPTKTAGAPTAGEPVRVRVVVAEDDGKGGVKYKVETAPAAAPKQPAGKLADPQPFLFKLAVPADGAAPGHLYYHYLPSGEVKKAEGAAPKVVQDYSVRLWDVAVGKETDAAFLRRAVTEARGTPPTALEERYFTADPDPRKREKLLDALLTDPAALRRVGDGWKRRMLAAPAAPPTGNLNVVPYNPKGVAPHAELLSDYLLARPKVDLNLPHLLVQPKADVPTPKVVAPAAPAVAARAVGSGDRWQRLVADLIAVGKTDQQILEALTLAAAGRLPTDVERRLTLAALPAAGDRAATWAAVARALAGPPAAAAPPVPLPRSKQ